MKEYIAEYIVSVVPADEKGKNLKFDFMNAKRLIQCKDCIHHQGYICDGLYGLQDAFTLQDDDYCSRAEPKDTTEEVRKQLKDMEQRREMDRKK